eukprot:scaffold1485_cov171-Amphora_coffeaeformis.AAC.1
MKRIRKAQGNQTKSRSASDGTGYGLAVESKIILLINDFDGSFHATKRRAEASTISHYTAGKNTRSTYYE